MTYIIALESKSKDVFEHATQMEQLHPEGEWLYFDFHRESSFGLFTCSTETQFTHFTPHPKFMETFLGLFSPADLKAYTTVKTFSGFSDFCLGLNNLLKQEAKIKDLSRTEFWIWAEDSNLQDIIPAKLLEHLSVN